MQRFLTALIVCVLVMGSCASCMTAGHDNTRSSFVPDERASLIDHMVTTTVVIIAKEEPNEKSLDIICSGVWISPRRILTAQHCAVAGTMEPLAYMFFSSKAQRGEIDITGRKIRVAAVQHVDMSKTAGSEIQEAWTGTVIATSPADDLAIIETNSNKHRVKRYAKIANRQLYRGEKIHAVGHGGGLLYAYYKGYISHPARAMYSVDMFEHRDDPTSLIVQIDTGIWRGGSGGGVFDERGQVIAMVSMLAGGQTSMLLAIHHSMINNLIKKADLASTRKHEIEHLLNKSP